MDFRIFLQIKKQGEQHGNDLSDDGGDCRSRNAHFRHSKETEDHDRIEDNVNDRAESLGDHGVKGFSGRLQETLEGKLHKNAERAGENDGEVLRTVFDNKCLGRFFYLDGEEKPGAENPHQRKHDIAENAEKNAVVGCKAGVALVLCAKTARKQRIYADAGAGCNRCHQILHGERQRNGGQRILVDSGYKNAVYDIVERLHQHREHDRQRHGDQQLRDRHDAHFVFFYLGLLHVFLPFFLTYK